MAKNDNEIILALAGICQSARLVQQLAHEGHCDNDDMLVCFNSIIELNPLSTLAVFGDETRNLRTGLETLLAILGAALRQGNNEELMRYTLSMIMLERKLSASKTRLDELGKRIQGLHRQLDHFPLDSETLINAMAAIYLDIISPLGARIQVTGEPSMLQLPLIQAKVRATLLAGMRAAVLWRQVGGRRLQLMFSRNRLINQAKQILAQC